MSLLSLVSSAFTCHKPFDGFIFTMKTPRSFLRHCQKCIGQQGCCCYNVLTKTDSSLIFNYNALNQGWLAGWLWEYKPNSKPSQNQLADSIQSSCFVSFLTNPSNVSENSPVTHLNRQPSEEVVQHQGTDFPITAYLNKKLRRNCTLLLTSQALREQHRNRKRQNLVYLHISHEIRLCCCT